MVIGLALFLQGIRWMRQKRLIENIPTSKIRSIAMGLVEVYGTVTKGFTRLLRSPLTDKECVYYKYKVEEHRGSGKNSRWVTILQGEDSIKFLLTDNTGTVLVDPKGAKVDIPADFNYSSHIGLEPPETVKRHLAKHGKRFEGLFGINKSMRFREHYIAPKDNLYVLGTAADNPFVKEASRSKGVEDVMIRKGDHEKMFYISDKDEKGVLASLTWKVMGGMVGGGLLAVGSLAVILLSLGM